MNNQGTQWQRFYGSGTAGSGGELYGIWGGISSLRPFHELVPDDDNKTREYFNGTIFHPPLPGAPPDVPWINDLLPGDGFVIGDLFNGICFAGGAGREEVYVVALAGNDALGTVKQILYRCDAWCSRAVKVKDNWITHPSGDDFNRPRCVEMIHWKSDAGEGMATYSLPTRGAGNELSRFVFWDFNGNIVPGVGGPTFVANITTGQVQTELVYCCRGDELGRGEAFGVVRIYTYETGAPTVLESTRYEIWNLRSGVSLYQYPDEPPFLTSFGQQQTYIGQPTFDFTNRRLLWPEMKVERTTVGAGVIPVSSKLRQLTLRTQSLRWGDFQATVIADVPGFTALPLTLSRVDDPDPDFPSTYAPLLEPRLAWYHGGEDQVYINFGGRTVIDSAATPPPFYGLVRFNPDGSNPRIVSKEGLATAWGEQFLTGFPGSRVALGWGCRALWEL